MSFLTCLEPKSFELRAKPHELTYIYIECPPKKATGRPNVTLLERVRGACKNVQKDDLFVEVIATRSVGIR